MTNKVLIDSSVLIESFKGNKIVEEAPELMSKYNLLPNDAIILATCKLYGTKLASHDSDFIIPCREENIELIRDDTDPNTSVVWANPTNS